MSHNLVSALSSVVGTPTLETTNIAGLAFLPLVVVVLLRQPLQMVMPLLMPLSVSLLTNL